MSELHVVFQVSGTEYVLPASAVVQMESWSGATKVPGTASYVLGIVQLRGAVVPVVDLRARFHQPPHEATIDSRIVVAKSGERAVGLLVDSAREVVKIAAENFKPPPPLVAREAEGFVKSVAQVGQRMFMLVDFERVVGEDHGHVE